MRPTDSGAVILVRDVVELVKPNGDVDILLSFASQLD